MYANRKNRLTHVLALEVTTGEAANGRCALHHCDNPPCCNPKHLYWGSRLDNTRDRDQRGRHVSLKGERHGCAILTEAQVREIKRRHIPRHPIHGGSALGREFGVNTSTINKVVLGKHWTHI
jgi:hypothetical protein